MARSQSAPGLQPLTLNIDGDSIRNVLSHAGPWLRAHVVHLGLIGIILAYSIRRKKLTNDGILAALVTGLVHMLHPSNTPFALLLTFFLAGTIATRVKHDQKASLTKSYTGSSAGDGGGDGDGKGGEGPRNSIQVLANSATASLLVLADVYFASDPHSQLRLFGIITVYAAAAADTLSSELGILAPSQPFLITDPQQRVPRGTNGGVTWAGFGFALLGGAIVAVAACISTPWFEVRHAAAVTLLGLFGSVVDSVLGATLQATVVDAETGLVVEGANGRAIPTSGADGPRPFFPISSPALLFGMLAGGIGKGYFLGPFADPFMEYFTVMALSALVCLSIPMLGACFRTPSDSAEGHSGQRSRAGGKTNRNGDGSMAGWVRKGVDAASNNDINFYMIVVTTSIAMLLGNGLLSKVML